jgi:hypothetical protein
VLPEAGCTIPNISMMSAWDSLRKSEAVKDSEQKQFQSSDFKVRLDKKVPSRRKGKARDERENGEIGLSCLPEKLNPFK